VVGTPDGARAALATGCERLILSWEANLTAESGWTIAQIDEICSMGKEKNTPVLMTTPRVLDNRSATELRQLICASTSLKGFAVTSVGALQLVQNSQHELWADAALNTFNAKAAEWLQQQGIARIMPSLESSLESIAQMSQAAPSCRFDLLAHGPLTGMLLEHCLIAMHIQHASKADFCPMPCAVDTFSMVDKAGNRRPIKPDRYCRNHIMMEHDLATLPHLDKLLAVHPASLRIHAATYEPERIEKLIRFYRDWLHHPQKREGITADFNQQFPSDHHTLGAYPLGIARDDEISRINLKREEMNAES
jgi:U32 family peptidase